MRANSILAYCLGALLLLLCTLTGRLHCEDFESELIASGEEAPQMTPEVERTSVPILEGIKEKIGLRLEMFMEPAKRYTALVNRYRNWFLRYRTVERIVGGSGKLKPIKQILIEEYAKVDDELMERKCRETMSAEAELELAQIKSARDPREIRKEAETMDFIFDVLTKLTNRLETRLLEDSLELDSDQKLDNIDQLDFDHEENEENNYRIRKAVDRLKRVAWVEAAKLLFKESIRLSRIAALSALANYFINNPAVDGDPMQYVQKIIFLVAYTDVPLAVAYLRDVELRTAWLAISKLASSAAVTCKLPTNIKS